MRWVDLALARLEDTLIAALLLSGAVIICVNVVLRYVFSGGLVWAAEFVRYEIIWMVFIGGSVAVRKGIHIGVDVALHVLPPMGQRILRSAVDVICILFCLALVIYGAELTRQTQAFGQLTAAMQVPMWTVQLAVPIGAGLMLLRFGQRLWLNVRGIELVTEVETIS